MGIKTRLTILSFLQFFIWGSWLISIFGYLTSTLHFSPIQAGSVFTTFGIASLFMPALLGIVADKWINAEKIFGLTHLLGAVCLIFASFVKDPTVMFWVMLLNSMFYMPTIALSNSISYRLLVEQGIDVRKAFPPIRVWGTIGFIVALWIVDLTKLSATPFQFFLAAAGALALGLFSFTLPPCPPDKESAGKSVISSMGLDAFVLFKDSRMAVFFIFSLLIGAVLQVSNMYADSFIGSFGDNPANQGAFVVEHSKIIISFSQISETIFILTIPFFLRKYGIKMVMIFSMLAWVFRFGLFGLVEDPNSMPQVSLLFLSMIVYGMAFDFFNISGSLFVERETHPKIRASAQGLFMMMTNGFGTILGSTVSSYVIEQNTIGKTIIGKPIYDWTTIWFIFAAYALVLILFFALLFKYKHFPEEEMDALSTRH
jgi:NHS family xanthosine MFS transporter